MSAPTALDPGGTSHLVDLPGGPFQVWRWVCVRGAGFPAALLHELGAPATAAAADRCLAEAEAGATDGGAFGALEAAYAADMRSTRRALRGFAVDPRFREAVTWQNPQALRNGVASLLASPIDGARNRRARGREWLVASYLQRYCAKNESIGFFGPFGWARVASGADPVLVRPGPQLLAGRRVFLESWAVEALGQRLAQDPELRPWCCPRLVHYLRLEGDTLRAPDGRVVPLAPLQARVLAACDGRRTAQQIAAEIGGEAGGAGEILPLLEQAQAFGIITWTFEVPLTSHPERVLRRALERIEPPALQRRALGALDALEAARARVAEAAGDPARLDPALADLEQRFTEITSVRGSRMPGRIYAGRTLVYEDCRRDAEVQIGPSLLARLGPPLTLLLRSARWVTWEIGRRYGAAILALHEALAARAGSPVVELALLLGEAMRDPALNPATGAAVPVQETFRELTARWARIFEQPPPGARRVDRAAEEIRAAVEAEFDAPGPPWSYSRYLSPDVLIAADGPEAIRRGDYLIVIGEVHPYNTLSSAALLSQHPAPDELVAALERDLPPRVIPVSPRTAFASRTNPGLVSPRDYRFLFDNVAPPPGCAPDRLLQVGDLVVEREGAGLVVRSRDGRARFDLLEFTGALLGRTAASTAIPLLPPRPHTPRVTVGGVVLAREAWRFSPAELPFRAAPPGARQVLDARAWARQHGLPRYVFVKAPVEPKPLYIDLDSPLYLEILAGLARRAEAEGGADPTLVVTEMLPDIEQAWLPDAEGRRYTCELRMAVLDPAPAAPAWAAG